MVGVDLPINLEGLEQATKQLAAFGKSADSSLKGVADSFSLIKKAAAIALAGITFKEIVSGAEEADQAVLRLNTTLKLSGDFSGEASKRYQDLASTLQKTSNITDEAIMSLVAHAKAIGVSENQTENLVKASVDLAAVMGTDVNTAFSDLEKTLSGTVSKSLKNRFPELKQLSIESLAAGDAVTLLGNRFKGAAEELNNTFSGQRQGVAIAFGEIFESIGKIITQNPAFVAALKLIKDTLFDIAEFISNNVNTAIEGLNAAIRFVTTLIANNLKVLAPLIAAFAELLPPIKALGIVAIPVFKTIYDAALALSKVFVEVLAGAIDGVIKGVKVLAVGLLEVIKRFQQFRGNTEAVKQIQDQIDSLVESTFNQTNSIAENTIAIRENVDAGKEFIDGLTEQEKAQSKLTNATVKASVERQKAIQEEIDAQQRQIKEAQRGIIQNAASSPFQFFETGGDQLQKFSQTNGVSAAQSAATKGQAQIAQGIGIGANIFQGQGGANNVITQALGLFANSLLPGIGAVVQQIAGVLAQGPEASVKFVQAFIDSVPVLIENIAASIGPVIDALIAGIPRLIERLVSELPGIAVKFALSLSSQSGFIATQFAIEFVKHVPDMVKGLVQGIVDAIKEAIGSIGGLFGGGGGGGGGLLSDVGGFFGFAEGGTVPGTAPYVDKVPIMATPGEGVVKRDTMAKLESFLNRAAQSSAAQNLTVVVKLGEQEVSRFLTSLDQRGFRT